MQEHWPMWCLATYSMQKVHLVQHVFRKGSPGQGLCYKVLPCLAAASPGSSQPCSAASDVVAIQAPPVGACLHKHIILQIHFSRRFGNNFGIKAKPRQILTRTAVVHVFQSKCMDRMTMPSIIAQYACYKIARAALLSAMSLSKHGGVASASAKMRCCRIRYNRPETQPWCL